MNIFNPSLFSLTAPCLPCCTTPTVCACYLPIGSNMFTFPPTAFVDYATAAAVVADPLQVPSCVAFFVAGGTPTTVTATLGTNSLTLDQTSAAFTEPQMWSSLNLTGGEVLSAAYSGSASGGIPGVDTWSVSFLVYDCLGNLLHSDFTLTTSSGTFTYTIPTSGAYTVVLLFGGCVVLSCGWTAQNVVLSATTLTVNPVIAFWDDSGTTRQLWACPKLELPPLTESSGTWYANSGAAATAISTLTSNCVGYIESMTNVTTFTATDGGSTLTLAETLTAGAMSCPTVWGGVNAVNGQTLTFTLTTGAGTAKVTVSIYDDVGVLVQASGLQNSPWTSSALPYKGRYTFSVAMSSTSSTTSYSLVISSSSTMTVNHVQALWDNGLDCPSSTDC